MSDEAHSALPIPPSFQEKIRYGVHRECTCKIVRGIVIYIDETMPGTEGKQCHYNPGLALRLTQVLVQQRFDIEAITAKHFDPKNMGFFWVRRQGDPEAASASLIARVDHTRKPMLPASLRHARILELLKTGEVVSQAKLVRHVGTAWDSDTQNDIKQLAVHGAIVVEVVPHGKVLWKQIRLAVPVDTFWEISRAIRKDLADNIAKKKAQKKWQQRKGFKSIPHGYTADAVPSNNADVNPNNPKENRPELARDPEPTPRTSEPPRTERRLTFEELIEIAARP